MKKIFKVFGLILLLFITIANCRAINDCRFVKNSMLVENIKTKISCLDLNKSYGSDEPLLVDYGSVIFARDCKNINHWMLFVPIMTVRKGVVGEIPVCITVQNAGTIEDIFEGLKTASPCKLRFEIKVFNPIFPIYINNFRYMSDWLLESYLKSFSKVKHEDRVYYMLSPNCSNMSFENLCIVHESTEKKGVVISKGFIFNASGRLKPISLKPTVEKVSSVKSFFSSIFYSSPENQGYTSLLTSGSDSLKQKIYKPP